MDMEATWAFVGFSMCFFYFILGLFAHYKPQYSYQIAWVFLLAILSTITAGSLMNFGFITPALYLSMLAPIFATFLLGFRGGFIFACLSILILIALYQVEINMNLEFKGLLIEDQKKLKLIVIILGIFATLGVAYLFEKTKLKNEINLENAFKDIESSEFLLNETSKIANIGGWSLETHTGKLWWSEQTYRIHELEVNSPISVERAVKFYTEDSRKTISQAIEHAIKSGTGWELQAQIVTAKNRLIWVEAVGQVFKDEHNQITLKGTFQDITEKKMFQNQLDESYKKLMKAAMAKSQFLANMSHEIRTPMNGVLGHAELLSEETLEEHQKKYVKSIILSGRSIMKILNDILDFSKIEAGKLSIDMHDFNVKEEMKSIFDLYMTSAQSKGLDFNINISDGLPEWVYSDATRIRQIISNLVSNSLKFTDKGVVSISVEKMKEDGERIEIRFSVQDSGIGIKIEDKEKLFEEFSQADLSTTRKYGGTGLGLAICQKLVKLLGSDLKVESEYGKGTTFFFDLKVKNGTPVSQESKDKHLSTLLDAKNLRLLLVEDIPLNQNIAKELLKRLGITADIANHGKEALDLIKNKPYDVILMDCQMPVMDGYEATQEIRKLNLNKQPIIIALTANALSGDRELCEAAGMNDYISKPFTKKKLRETLEKWAQSFD